jgi:TatA/E family protein of Tat protein translocase
VVLLILESLGSTELLFILIMALVFFGPRKLPQLSRSLGKNLAEFRRASEDFKRTWEKEVSLEEYDLARDLSGNNPAQPPKSGAATSKDNARLTTENSVSSLQPPVIEAVTPDRVVARQSAGTLPLPDKTEADSGPSESNDSEAGSGSSPKHDWL